MKKLACSISFALTGCLATPADIAETTEKPSDEPVAETHQSLQSEPAQTSAVELPVWHAFLGGTGRNLRALHPSQSDYKAPLIFVREGEESRPERWVQLNSHAVWMEGDAYFDKLLECGGITPLDLIAMQVALQAFKDGAAPPDIRTLPGAHVPDALHALKLRSNRICEKLETRQSVEGESADEESTDESVPASVAGESEENVGEGVSAITEGKGDFNPFPGILPGPGGDHTGQGPSGRKPGGTSSSRGNPPPSPSKLGAWVVNGTPNDGTHRGPRTTPSPAAVRDKLNGIQAGDPKPVPFEAPDYTPYPGEEKETFRCNGTVVYGYKGGCVDFANDTVLDKWTRRMATFLGKNSERFHRWVYHHVWNDGKNPECMKACNHISNGACAGLVGAAATICAGMTGGACVLSLPGAIGWVGGGIFAGGECLDHVRDQCATNICTQGK